MSQEGAGYFLFHRVGTKAGGCCSRSLMAMATEEAVACGDWGEIENGQSLVGTGAHTFH